MQNNNDISLSRRGLIAGSAAMALTGITPLGLPALTSPAKAQALTKKITWRFITAWPKGLPGPGTAADFIAKRVGELSNGAFTLHLHAAGEIVPALEVFDAIASGVAEAGHAASFFWRGKMPASPYFTTMPFGLDPLAHLAWLEFGGGQGLWDRLYAPHGVGAWLGGNTGPSLAGWFRKPLKSIADLQGLKIRTQGIGAEIWRKLGAVPVSTAPGEITTSLSSGVVDAVEFLAPANDIALGLHKAAPYVYAPSFNKPNGAAEFLYNKAAYAALPPEFQIILQSACREAHQRGLAEALRLNGVALQTLKEKHNMSPLALPQDIINAARKENALLLNNLAATDALARDIGESYAAFLAETTAWQEASRKI